MNDLRIILGSGGPYPFILIDGLDHRSPLPGKTPTVQISKDGNAFAPPVGIVTEVGFGAYELGGAAADSEVVGPVLLHATDPAADPTDTRYDVVSALGVVPLVTGSETYHPLPFLLISAGDHVTGLTGAAPTVTVRKQGGAFAPPDGAITEVGFGWYCWRPTPADIDTPGSLLLHATAAGADPTDERWFVAGRFIPGPGVNTDFLSALANYWESNSALNAISPALFYGAAPAGAIWPSGDYYPYAVAMLIGTKSRVMHGMLNLNTGPGYVEDQYYQISVYHPQLAEVIRLSEIMTDALDPILKTKLTFANGYQMTWYRTGSTLIKVPTKGPAGNTIVYQRDCVYRAMIGRSRATA